MPDAEYIDWTKAENSPRKLIEKFKDYQPPADLKRPPIKMDIPQGVLRYKFADPDPLSYEIVVRDEKGKTSIDRNALIQFMRDSWIVYDAEIPYKFNGCIYVQIDNSVVSRFIYQAIDQYSDAPFLSRNAVLDIIAKFKVTNTPYDIYPPSGWNEDGAYDGNIIPFCNCIYNVDRDEVLPFTPYLFVTHQLKAWYDPKITEHPVSAVYEGILPDAQTRKFFYEMAGYSLFSPTMSPPAIFLVYGPGNTGKSALQEAVTCAAGRENVSSLDIAQISGDFTTAEMVGKLINICGETGSGQNRNVTSVDGELLKRLSDGQPITVQRKYGHPFQMCNTAKLWFVSNTLPDFGDTSSGLYRRLFIVPCRHEQRWDDQIYTKMQEEKAQSWLINMMLEGYRDFIDNGRKFHVSAEMMSERSSYKKQDALMDFIEQSYGTSDKSVIADKFHLEYAGELYEEYKAYVLQSGGRPVSIRKFTEKVRNEFTLDTEKVRTVQFNGNPTYRVRFVKQRIYR